MSDSSILWRRLDRPGHEAARLARRADRWHLAGCAVFAADGGDACALEYEVICDGGWRTIQAEVNGWVGARPVDLVVEVVDGRWILDGTEVPSVGDATDIDLNFSPSTNLLPIRRLGLAVGEEARVVAAWLRFPSFALEQLEQTYRRTGPASWRYESAGGRFTRELEVNEDGFVTHYPGFWSREG